MENLMPDSPMARFAAVVGDAVHEVVIPRPALLILGRHVHIHHPSLLLRFLHHLALVEVALTAVA
jgi:hypothetical protein